MRTVRTKIYKFEELDEKAQAKAFQHFANVNVDGEWYESTYSDAENIGLTIAGFDIDRREIHGKLLISATDAADRIIANHGENCETFKTAKAFIARSLVVDEKYKVGEDEEYDQRAMEAEQEEVADFFENQLLQDYLILLRDEYECQTSESAIKQTIEANEWEFYENGQPYYPIKK